MCTGKSACQRDASSSTLFETETLKKITFCHRQEKKDLKTTVIRVGSIPLAQFLLLFLLFSTHRDIMQKCTFTSICVWYYRKGLCFYVSFFTNTQIALGTPETVPGFQGVKLVPPKGYLTGFWTC